MSTRPLVSVVMPVFNTEKYVAEAIESILNQTYSSFEFLIFDDGSTDNSKNIIAQYAARDKRIVPFYSDKNSGYADHLNKGILLARSDFVARMDSDDISMVNRLSLQVEFLQKNPHVSVVGSSSIRINEDGKELGLSLRNTSSAELLWQSFFTNPLAHPTVMFRKSAIIKAGLYNPITIPSEDFDLWTRVLQDSKLANLDIPLLKYREHFWSISSLKSDLQNLNSIQSLRDHWLYFCKAQVTDDIAHFFKNFHKGFELESLSVIRAAYYLIMKLYFDILKRQGLVEYIEKDAFNKLFYLALRSSRYSVIAFLEFMAVLGLLFPLRLFRKLIKYD